MKLPSLHIPEGKKVNVSLFTPFRHAEGVEVPVEYEAGWDPEPGWTCGRRERFLLLLRFVLRTAKRLAVVTIRSVPVT